LKYPNKRKRKRVKHNLGKSEIRVIMKVLIPILSFIIGLIVIIISLSLSLVDDTGLGLLFYIGLITIIPFIIGLIIELIEKRKKNYQTQLLKDEKIPLSPFSRYSITDNDLAVVNKNLEILKYKINNISNKLYKIKEYNKLLTGEIDKNKETNDIYSKNVKFIEYLNSFIDKYKALYLEAYFSQLMYFINKNKNTLDIKSAIEKLKNDMINVIEKYFPHYISFDVINKLYEQSGKVIERIFNDIDNLKTQLIAYQSQLIYSSISPIKNEGEYNLVKNFSGSDNSTIDVNSLTNEYDRFISEYEITEENK